MEDSVQQGRLNAYRVGIKESEFLKLTPYLLSLYIEQYIKSQQEKYREMLSVAWQNANWVRSKKMPSYRSVMEKAGAQFKDQTPEDHEKIIKQLHAMYGGTLEVSKN